jgi:GNAT superfamily N-acetyltransferase
MWTNEKILKLAMEQSARDLSCKSDDFFQEENIIVLSKNFQMARKYLNLPFLCQLVSYGKNIVASVSPDFFDITKSYIDKFPVAHAFETPNIHVLEATLEPLGAKICFMAEYFLPDVNKLHHIPSKFSLKTLEKGEFEHLYTKEWTNALCKDRKHLDILAIGAYDGDRLVGLAGCSADCEKMWQIGVDVLPEYRRQGIAAALTSALAIEIFARGKVPFYCAAWCNLPSVRNAIKSGFYPAWVEMTAKPIEFVNKMNGDTQS